MKKKVADATIEEILQDVSSFEDIGSAVLVMPNEDGGVYICDYEGRREIEAPTLKEALIKYRKYGPYEEDLLDWS